jgi:hypothetical protein
LLNFLVLHKISVQDIFCEILWIFLPKWKI